MRRCHVGRFAPSPSGRMHLGNIYAALLSWLSVKSKGGIWILRIEDIDPRRSKPEFVSLIEEDLQWLELEWDEGGSANMGEFGPYVQSLRSEHYSAAIDQLNRLGLTYCCTCSRHDIHSSSAPHASDGRIIYSGKCRPNVIPRSGELSQPETPHSIRIAVPDEVMVINDLINGRQEISLSREFGDFVLRRSDGAWAYQLATTVDDALMGISEVVRGVDLLSSSAPQAYLMRLLGFNHPQYIHIPLLVDKVGRRLSKRDKSLAMDCLRRDFSPHGLVGKIAFLAGLRPTDEPVTPKQLLNDFDICNLSKCGMLSV